MLRHLAVLGALFVAAWLVAAPASAYTPTQTFGPSPTPTLTGTPPPPRPIIAVMPDPARAGQRVVLDGSGSFRGGGYRWSQVGGEVSVEIADADQAIASFVVPPLSAPSEVVIQLTLFNDFPGQQRIALLPADTVRLEVGQVIGAPGGTVEVDVTLRTLGYAVTALHHELRFDAFAAVAEAGAGLPDCGAGTGFGVDSAAFTFVPPGCTPGTDCSGVHAAITALGAIPDGSVVYRCNVAIDDGDPAPSCFHALACAEGEARRAGGAPLAIVCIDGGVTADYRVRPLGFEFHADPANPAVGDLVRLTFRATGEGGLPGYSLRGAAPFLRIIASPTPNPSSGPLGNPVVFDAIADCPGVAQLGLFLTYETRCGCPGEGGPFFCFTDASSPAFALAVREPGTFNVSGRVAEFPAGCQGAMRGVTVRLDPPGWTTQTDLAAGHFSFGGVAPGTYTLSVSPSCNPFGCWPVRAIEVGGGDVDVTLCPQREGREGCAGDCDDDGSVMVHELLAGVSIALGIDDLVACPAVDGDGNGTVGIDELILAIGRALDGCPGV